MDRCFLILQLLLPIYAAFVFTLCRLSYNYWPGGWYAFFTLLIGSLVCVALSKTHPGVGFREYQLALVLSLFVWMPQLLILDKILRGKLKAH